MVTLNGREVVAREVWRCACSGGCGGEFSPRCAGKGGKHRTVLVDRLTGEEVAYEFDSWEADRLVRDWGWRDLGEGFLARPGT